MPGRTYPEQLDQNCPVGAGEVHIVRGVQLRDLLGHDLDHLETTELVRVADVGVNGKLDR
jgi:hypothetical protein